MFLSLKKYLREADNIIIPEDRQGLLRELASHISQTLAESGQCKLNFICTHNSRRSHFAQVWAHLAATFHGIDGVQSFSGGLEATEVNSRALAALARAGFLLESDQSENPQVKLQFSEDGEVITAFSKVYDHINNPQGDYFAILVCSDVAEKCPYIPSATIRFPLTYSDPKEADGTPGEAAKYDERSLQIASEMLFLFSLV